MFTQEEQRRAELVALVALRLGENNPHKERKPHCLRLFAVSLTLGKMRI